MYTSSDEKWVRVALFIALGATMFLPFIHHALVYGAEVTSDVVDWKSCVRCLAYLTRLISPV